jgi:hypothetical protein
MSNVAIVFALVSLLFFPIIFAPLGVVLSAFAYTRGERRWAIAMAMAIVCGLVGFAFGFLVAVAVS